MRSGLRGMAAFRFVVASHAHAHALTFAFAAGWPPQRAMFCPNLAVLPTVQPAYHQGSCFPTGAGAFERLTTVSARN